MDYLSLEKIINDWDGMICIFGAGLIGSTWGYELLVAAGGKVDFYCDNKQKVGKIVRDNIKILPLDDLYGMADDVLVWIMVNGNHQKGIEEQLINNGIKNYHILGDREGQDIYFSIENTQDNSLIHKYHMYMDDSDYLRQRFEYLMGYPLDLDNPKTFNEKLQWLKIHDRKPEYTMMVDKVSVKKYIESKIGKEYVIPTLGVWDEFDDIDFASLPNQFVIKTNNDSGGVMICRDKEGFDLGKAKEKLETSLKNNYYINSREWSYKSIIPKIMVEPYLEDFLYKELRDYKFFVFSGVVRFMFVASERQKKDSETKFDFFDATGEYLNLMNGHPNARKKPELPHNFYKMVELAETLGANMRQVRIDFYEVNGKIYFGEITFFHWSGLVPFNPQKWDEDFGKWIEIND